MPIVQSDGGPLGAWLEPFAAALGRPAWRRALVLVAGAILAPGRRTVASALRVTGLGNAPGFAGYHRLLSESRWSGLALARRLLVLLVAAFAPDGPVVVALDDTLERRWGRRIRARGIYRDPVRSSHGHFVKASGRFCLRSRQTLRRELHDTFSYAASRIASAAVVRRR